MKLILNRTGKIIRLFGNGIYDAEIIYRYGYRYINVLDIENHMDVDWEGIKHNRLYVMDNIVYQFNNWFGTYPYEGVEIEEIGILVDDLNYDSVEVGDYL